MIVAAHRNGSVSPAQSIQRCYEGIRALADPGISLRDEEAAIAEAEALSVQTSDAPLFGVPVAVKDNIDVAGLPTTVRLPGICLFALPR